tara:strand:- start:829 stop:1044 length:216 start_codon:yes stop_codon:yes gene_type:complete
MKVLFAMILLMIVAAYGCTTDDSPALEQSSGDLVEVGDITVEDVEELSLSDTEVSLDDVADVPTVEEEVEN